MMLQKNQIHTAEITGYTADGAGVCRIEGRAVFVKGTIIGELWEVRILKVTSSAVYGKGERCLSPSSMRQQPPCPVFRKCGGCSLLHMTYGEELNMKRARVNDALHHIGGIDAEISVILEAEMPEHYRNKAIYNVGTADGKTVKGFYRASTHEVTPVEACLLQKNIADRAAETICRWMDRAGFAPYDEQTGKGTVRHIFTRCAVHTSDTVVCITSARGFGSKTDALVDTLREACPELTGIVLNINKQKGNVVLSGDFYTLWGEPDMTDTLCGLRFRIAPQAFYQINPPQAERLYDLAVRYAVQSESDTVLDLYCGAGTISLCLAQKAGHVIGAEIVPEAIENANFNASENGIANAEFVCADAGAAAAMLSKRGLRPNAVVVDPPRKGMSPAAIDAIVSMHPERIVYVSCDPGTLARDLKLLTAQGYAFQEGCAVDMFPHTPHVETVVLLHEKNVGCVDLDLESDRS